ncbi:MAG: DNA repair protein RecO [Oscillospiraceae bacterium]|nr:DNA repair protein RecO [Oscillospiraceae bacterium]
MHKQTHALVLRETAYKDYDKMLTVLTPEDGKLSVLARGARRRGSPHIASSQLLAYSEYTLFVSKGRHTLDDSETIDLFFDLRQDIKSFSFGIYFAELLDAVCVENVPCADIFELALWGLNALGRSKRPAEIIKAAFELRLMSLSGFEPDLDEHEHRLTPGALDAMRHILSCEPQRLVSFALNDDDTAVLSKACEQYVVSQVEKSFASLEFM